MATNKIGYKENIDRLTQENTNFRNVVYTSMHCQLVLMELKPLEEIGFETHKTVDQFFRFAKGRGKVFLNSKEYLVGEGDVVIVPMGSRHNVVNISETENLKLYTIYTPPHHKDKVVRATKKDAKLSSPVFDGVFSE